MQPPGLNADPGSDRDSDSCVVSESTPRSSGKVAGETPGRATAAVAGADYAQTTVRALRAVLRMQSIAAMVLAGLLLLNGPIASYSSLFGSLAAYLPGAFFVLLMARRLGGDTNAFLRTAALGEFGKLFLTGLLVAVVFIWVKPIAAGWFFTGMLVVMVVGWIGLARAIH